MTYSFNTPCDTCEKNESCLDSNIIGASINAVYQVGNAHKGSGRVNLECDNFVDKNSEDTPSTPG